MSTDTPLVTLDFPTSLHQGGANGRITRVVMHGTVSPCVRGGAKNNARYFQSPAAGGAAHYIVDPDDVAQCIREAVSAHHAPPNQGSLGVELCDPQAGPDERWADGAHTDMLVLAARLVADICARHSLPVQWLSASQLLAGDTGITSHANVAQAWHKTDHTDPGAAFPVEYFLALVAGGTPPQIPPQHAHQEDPMFIKRKGATSLLLQGKHLNVAKQQTVDQGVMQGLPLLDLSDDEVTWNSVVHNFGDPVA